MSELRTFFASVGPAQANSSNVGGTGAVTSSPGPQVNAPTNKSNVADLLHISYVQGQPMDPKVLEKAFIKHADQKWQENLAIYQGQSNLNPFAQVDGAYNETLYYWDENSKKLFRELMDEQVLQFENTGSIDAAVRKDLSKKHKDRNSGLTKLPTKNRLERLIAELYSIVDDVDHENEKPNPSRELLDQYAWKADKLRHDIEKEQAEMNKKGNSKESKPYEWDYAKSPAKNVFDALTEDLRK